MAWIPLRDRLHQLPLVLAGPILRRTEPTAVTVWVALRQPCRVTLRVFETAAGQGLALGPARLEGTRATIALGHHLHLVAVTATLQAGQPLQSGQIYAYDLHLEPAGSSSSPCSLQQALNADGISTPISYFDHGLPTFVLPPLAIDDLVLLHGSCRKTHGGGIDALPIVDELLQQSAQDSQRRPHQLFLTGDQIYSDDVANPWLFALTDASQALLGWEEALPTDPQGQGRPLMAHHLSPGDRTHVVEHLAGATAGFHNKTDHINSHLLSLGEYTLAYLFAWSPVLWGDWPRGEERYQHAREAAAWNREVASLQAFGRGLGKVQRALANIPTYMIFDDHEISDDWYLNRAWCERVLGRPLGRRMVQNGLLAYALTQAWGNTPDQFGPGTAGDRLLTAAQAWAGSGGTDLQAEATLAQRLGLPRQTEAGQPNFRADSPVWVLDHHPEALCWHYTVRSSCHEVIVLDTRTWRGYPDHADAKAVPRLLSPTALKQQLQQPLNQTQAQGLETIIVAPTNVIHLQVIDWAQQWSLRQGNVFGHDVGDSWNLHELALAELLRVLFSHRDRLIVLSGDIHYGFAAQLTYWQTSATGSEPPQWMVQFTASALKNAELKTRVLQTKLKALLPERPREWMGWQHPPAQQELPRQWLWPWRRRPARPATQPRANSANLTPSPDWFYRIEWLRRQPAQAPAWGSQLTWLSHNRSGRKSQCLWPRWLRWVWTNRWLHEGYEVVGESNLGLVRFANFAPLAVPAVVCQELYWCPPWQPDSLVISRFEAELDRPAPGPNPKPLGEIHPPFESE